ncbi:MAG: glycoside hydrolase family 140 protein [Ferruginibacter sp.]
MKKYFTIILLFATLFSNAQLQPLKISANKRYFSTKDGKPFFWLGDTGWLLFKKCTKEETIKYLDDRKAKGFNVIQVMVLHEVSVTDAFGDSALLNKNIATPNLKGKYNFWDNIDFVLDEAAKRNIYIALVPIWGGNIKHVSVEQAKTYATFLAERYKNKSNIIWLNGGDIKGGDALDKWNMIGNTLRAIDKNHLIGFHPRGRNSSSAWFHNEAWLDFNMFQSGHKSYEQDTASNETLHYGEDNWRYVNDDYKLTPVKPTLDGEPSYENIPHGLHDSGQKRWTADDVRRYAYWEVFAGGAGFTYGNNSVMQFYKKGNKDGSFGANKSWDDELNTAGAGQMKNLKELILSKSYFDRVPDQSLVIDNGEKYNRVMATKGKGYVMFYIYNARLFTIATNKLNFTPKKATWFNPVDSQVIAIKGYTNTINTFDPPGEKTNGNDWVLILEK